MYKQYCLILTISFCYLTSSLSQTDPLDDYWRDVEKRKSLKSRANDEASIYDSIIFKNFGSSIYIVRQDYVYTKKNIRYVRNEDDYYGRSYAVGILTQGGIITGKHIYEPWNLENSNLPAKGYAPLRTTLSSKSIIDIAFITESKNDCIVLPQNDLVVYPISHSNTTSTRVASPDTNGTLMLLYHDSITDSFSRKIFKFSPAWEKGFASIDSQWINKDLIGGVYMNNDSTVNSTPVLISAILTKQPSGGFELISLDKAKLDDATIPKTKKPDEPLTPENSTNEKKNKRN